MLCPEIWNFKAPQHSLLIEQSSQLKEFPSIIKTHYFNHSVSGFSFFRLRTYNYTHIHQFRGYNFLRNFLNMTFWINARYLSYFLRQLTFQRKFKTVLCVIRIITKSMLYIHTNLSTRNSQRPLSRKVRFSLQLFPLFYIFIISIFCF